MSLGARPEQWLGLCLQPTQFSGYCIPFPQREACLSLVHWRGWLQCQRGSEMVGRRAQRQRLPGSSHLEEDGSGGVGERWPPSLPFCSFSVQALEELVPEPGSGLPAPFPLQPGLASLFPLGLQKMKAKEGESQPHQPRMVGSGQNSTTLPVQGSGCSPRGPGLGRSRVPLAKTPGQAGDKTRQQRVVLN